MLIVKDVSLYMVIRGNEDTISKQIPSILTESINKLTSKPISGNTNNKFIKISNSLSLLHSLCIIKNQCKISTTINKISLITKITCLNNKIIEMK